ncbi:MAG: hypothetical protein JXD21_02565 [Candidatus Omnitrophica bacterium]|nr:hypothetical protein [Candidatus Omnitrophota bacterium]
MKIKLLRAAIVLVLLSVIFWMVKDTLCGFILTRFVNRTTGLVMDIEKVKVNPFKGSLRLEGIKLLNPQNAQDTFVADIPLMYLDCALADTLRGVIHLEELELQVKEVWVVREKTGNTTFKVFDTLAYVTTGGKGPQPYPLEIPLKLKIDSFDFSLKKVVYKDYGKTKGAQTIEVGFDYSQHLENIDSIEGLLAPLGILAFTNTLKDMPDISFKNKTLPDRPEDQPPLEEPSGPQEGSASDPAASSSLPPSPDPVTKGVKNAGKTIADQTKNSVEGEVKSFIDRTIRDGIRSVLPLH